MPIESERRGKTVLDPIPTQQRAAQDYLAAKKAYTWDTIGDILRGQDDDTEVDYIKKQQLIRDYHDILAKLDGFQKELAVELEKTGRVNQTNLVNLMAQIARVEAAVQGGRPSVISARTAATADQMKYLQDRQMRFGAKTPLDLGEEETSSIGKLSTMVVNGRPSDSAGFMREFNARVKELGARDPTLIVPYIQEVQAKTGVNLMPVFTQTIAGKDLGADTYGIPMHLLTDSASAINEGFRAHKEGLTITEETNTQIAKHFSSIARDMGWATGEQLGNDYLALVKLVPGATLDDVGVSRSGDVMSPPPPETAAFEERAAWVNKAFDGKARLDADGNIYEIDDSLNPAEGVQKIDYPTASRIYGQPGAMKELLYNAGPKYLQDTRKRIIGMIEALQAPNTPIHVAIRNGIIASPEFKTWADKRGYIGEDGKPSVPENDLFNMYLREVVAAGKQRKRMVKVVEDANTAFNPDAPATDMERARAIRRSQKRGIDVGGEALTYTDNGLVDKADTDITSPSAAITSGATGPEKAADMTEESAGKQNTAQAGFRDVVDYKDVAEGRDPWKYRVYDDGRIQVIKKPGDTKITDAAPIDVPKSSRAYAAIREMTSKPEARAIIDASEPSKPAEQVTKPPKPYVPDTTPIKPEDKGKMETGEDEAVEHLYGDLYDEKPNSDGMKDEPPVEAQPETEDKPGGFIGALKGIKGPEQQQAKTGPSQEELGRQQRLEEINKGNINPANPFGLTPEQVARRERKLKLLRGETA